MNHEPRYSAFQRNNPARRPDWRWARASQLFNDSQYYSSSRDDAATGRALSYLRAFGTSIPSYRRKLMRGLGDIAAAHEIQGGPSGIRLEIEARILAKQTAQQIGRRVDLPAEAIVAFEQLFYSIADRLDATTYIATAVIGEIMPDVAGRPDFARLIKWTAYSGGVGPLDAMLLYVARKLELELLGSSSIAINPATRLAINALVGAHSLQIDESTALDIASKGKIVQKILENKPRKRLLADVFAAQTSGLLENLATRTRGSTAEGPLEEPAKSESVEAA